MNTGEGQQMRVLEILAQALETQRQLTEIHADLAMKPDPEGPREARAAALIEQRRELIQGMGLALLQAALEEGAVHLHWNAAPSAVPSVHQEPIAPQPAPNAVVTPLPQQDRGATPPHPPVEPRPPDPAALLRLAQRGLVPNWEDPTRSEPKAQLLHDAMDALGPPLVVDDEDTLEQEAQRVCREADRMERWLELDRNRQQLLLSYAAAKARYLQERARACGASMLMVAGLDPAFRLMNRFSKEYRPGFVWGLSRSHTPKRGQWMNDAEQYWHELLDLAGRSPKVETNPERALARLEATLEREPPEDQVREAALDVLASGVSASDPRLLRLLEPYVDALTGRPLKAVRRALRDDSTDNGGGEEGPILPVDWSCFSWTEGQVAVVIGGDRRAEAAERIQAAFRFSDVEWGSDVQGTKLDAIAERVRRRSVGMVIFLARLSSHGSQSVLLEACKEAEVPFIRVERGYGVTAVRLAIEQLYGQSSLSPTR